MDELEARIMKEIKAAGPGGITLSELRKRIPGQWMSPEKAELIRSGEIRYFPSDYPPSEPLPLYVNRPRNNRPQVYLARVRNHVAGCPPCAFLWGSVAGFTAAGVLALIFF